MHTLPNKKPIPTLETHGRTSQLQNANKKKLIPHLNTGKINTNPQPSPKNNTYREGNSQNRSPGTSAPNSHRDYGFPRGTPRAELNTENGCDRTKTTWNHARNLTPRLHEAKVPSPYSMPVASKPERKLTRNGSEGTFNTYYLRNGLRESDLGQNLQAENIGSLTLNIAKEKEELRNAIRDEWTKYQTEKQNFEKLMQDSAKNKVRISSQKVRQYSESPRANQDPMTKPLTIPNFAQTIRGYNNNSEVSNSYQIEKNEKKGTTASHLQTSLASLSPRNLNASQTNRSNPAISHEFPNKNGENDEYRSPSKTMVVVMQKDSNKSQSALERKSRIEIPPETGAKQSIKSNGKTGSSRIEFDRTPSGQYLYEKPTLECQTSIERDKHEFRVIRETLWDEEKKDLITRRNKARFEKLMEMDIGKLADEMTKELFKGKVNIHPLVLKNLKF